MKIEQLQIASKDNLDAYTERPSEIEPQLVLGFGQRQLLEDKEHYNQLKKRYPKAQIVLCSTAGEIIDELVCDGSLVISAIEFEHSKIEARQLVVSDNLSSFEAGKKLADDLSSHAELAGVLILADGQKVNGSELIKGLYEELGRSVPITGGLAGDGSTFHKTLVGLNESPEEGRVVGIGIYGERIKIGHGSRGGWDSFGPERIVTHSVGNVLQNLDDQNALDLYKRYLGDESKSLPGAALRFPLSIRIEDRGDEPIVRTILAIDEKEKTMTFAGDLPIGSRARFMKTNFDRLVDGAIGAAGQSLTSFEETQPEFALLISCVGRKLVLGPRVEEEVEGVREVVGPDTAIIGFYSYGEISPLQTSSRCELHNQTMTITTLSEL